MQSEGAAEGTCPGEAAGFVAELAQGVADEAEEQELLEWCEADIQVRQAAAAARKASGRCAAMASAADAVKRATKVAAQAAREARRA